MSAARIVIRRRRLFHGYGRRVPFGWLYDTTGPDGTRFDGTSIGDLRSRLRRRYPGAEIVEPWKASAS